MAVRGRLVIDDAVVVPGGKRCPVVIGLRGEATTSPRANVPKGMLWFAPAEPFLPSGERWLYADDEVVLRFEGRSCVIRARWCADRARYVVGITDVDLTNGDQALVSRGLELLSRMATSGRRKRGDDPAHVELMAAYRALKDVSPHLSDMIIAGRLGVAASTLAKHKREERLSGQNG